MPSSVRLLHSAKSSVVRCFNWDRSGRAVSPLHKLKSRFVRGVNWDRGWMPSFVSPLHHDKLTS